MLSSGLVTERFRFSKMCCYQLAAERQEAASVDLSQERDRKQTTPHLSNLNEDAMLTGWFVPSGR